MRGMLQEFWVGKAKGEVFGRVVTLGTFSHSLVFLHSLSVCLYFVRVQHPGAHNRAGYRNHESQTPTYS